jgi:hypothetical protein
MSAPTTRKREFEEMARTKNNVLRSRAATTHLEKLLVHT